MYIYNPHMSTNGNLMLQKRKSDNNAQKNKEKDLSFGKHSMHDILYTHAWSLNVYVYIILYLYIAVELSTNL